MLNKLKTWIIAVWKDPVLSKVISAIIIASGITIWAKVERKSIHDIYNLVINGLSFKIPIYFVLSLFGIILIYQLLKKYFSKKTDPLQNEKIGHFTFTGLFNILVDSRIDYGTRGMEWSGQKAPEDNLLSQFDKYSPILNRGVDMDSHLEDSGYIFGVLCPNLLRYGLVTKVDTFDTDIKMNLVKYHTSDDGYKFLALLEKYHFNYNRRKK